MMKKKLLKCTMISMAVIATFVGLNSFTDDGESAGGGKTVCITSSKSSENTGYCMEQKDGSGDKCESSGTGSRCSSTGAPN